MGALVFVVGSNLYRNANESSDKDLLIVSQDGDYDRDMTRRHWGPRCVHVECCGQVCEARHSNFALYFTELLRAKRWAWEPWLFAGNKPHCSCTVVYDTVVPIVRCIIQGLLADSIVAMWEYVRDYMRFVEADYPAVERPDYAADFEQYGWHTRAAYYIELELRFREVFKNIPLEDESQLWPNGEIERLRDLKNGKISKSSWMQDFALRRDELRERLIGVEYERGKNKEHCEWLSDYLVKTADTCDYVVKPAPEPAIQA